MEKISVCIPAFNEEQRIRRCLVSVSAQQGVDITEILVGINSSTDGTRGIAEIYAQTDRRVRVVDSPKGKANAWNALNAAARNNLRIFQDGDCAALPGSYARLVEALDGHDIVGASLWRDAQGKRLVVKILNFPVRYIASYKTLNGNLYLMDHQKVSNCLERKFGDARMPPDTINDDAFLGTVCNDVVMRDDVYVLIEPVDSVREEIDRYARMEHGDAQLQQRYPGLFKKWRQEELIVNMFGTVTLFRSATWLEKLLFLFVIPLKGVLFRYIHHKARLAFQNEPFRWK